MPVTQKDIALRLNISRSVVASVLIDQPGARVADDTRKRILDTAKEMGYRPNSVASNLRRGKTGVVMLVIRESGGRTHSMGGALETLAFGALDLGYDLKVRPFSSHAEMMAGLREIATSSVCDSIIVWAGEEDGEEAGQLLESLDFPFYIKGRYEYRHPTWFQVDFDHEQMMSLAVAHLADLGHQRIGYIGFQSPQVYIERLRTGYINAMVARFGPRFDRRWIGAVIEGHDVVDELLTEWLGSDPDNQPTALVVGAGYSAWNGIEIALARKGRRLGLQPGDFAAAGERPMIVPLIYGDAFAYDQASMSHISAGIIAMIENSRRSAVTVDRIDRITPELHRVYSLQLPLGSFESYTIPKWLS